MRVFGVDPGLTRCGVGVLDVWLTTDGANILEINPFESSDPCMFRGVPFDGTLKTHDGIIKIKK
jgi:hypothetical protein